MPAAPQGAPEGPGSVVEKTRPKLKRPRLYKVLMLNDDYTPMEFVVRLLVELFGMSAPRAEQVMLEIHRYGIGVCGVFPREIAETKVRQVLDYASANEHPLQCTLEAA